MTNERAIAELNQIYGFLSPEKQQAIDRAIGALETEKRLSDRLTELRYKFEPTGAERTEYYALVRLLEVENDE